MQVTSWAPRVECNILQAWLANSKIELKIHWVPHSFGFESNLSKTLSKLPIQDTPFSSYHEYDMLQLREFRIGAKG